MSNKIFNKVKKTLLAVLAIGTITTAANAVTIGVVLNTFNDTFISIVRKAMEDKAKELKINTTFVDGKSDVSVQIAAVEDLITKKVDAIIVIPTNTSGMGPITSAATKAKIPLIYVNSYPGAQPNGVYYVGSKEIEAGYQQATYLKNYLKKGDKVAILMGKLDHEGALKRTAGVEEGLKSMGVVILDKQTGNWNRPEGLDIAERWLLKYGTDLKAIISNNDDMALGAISALQQHNRKDVIVVGVDATQLAVAAIKNGTLAMTVFQDGEGQGAGGILTAIDAINGKNPPKERWIPFRPVTKANIDTFKNSK